MAEEAGGAAGRVEPGQLAPQSARLDGQLGQEPMDRLGVVLVAQQLAAAGAADVAPVQDGPGVNRRDAPTLAGNGHGGAVAAGQKRQPRIG